MGRPSDGQDQQDAVNSWFAARLAAAGWSGLAPGGTAGDRGVEVQVDREEILVLLPLAPGADVGAFRDATRDQRISLARQAESLFGRKVSWGAVRGGDRRLFTTQRSSLAVPLAMAERRVLDALVEAGVAASRTEAVAWCIRLVGHHEADWLRDLRDAVAADPPGRRDLPSAL